MNQRLVLDTSVIVKWLNTQGEQHVEQALEVLRFSQKFGVELYTPELARYELGNVLLMSKKLTVSEFQIASLALSASPLIFVPQSPAESEAIYAIAAESAITYYDAAFLALAKSLDAPLLTENKKHQGKTHEVEVIAIADFSLC